MIFAILLVYLLMVVNFQCWLDPLIILMALPGALRDFVDAVFDADDVQRAVADGRDYDDWRGDGELDFAGYLCNDERWRATTRGGAGRGLRDCVRC